MSSRYEVYRLSGLWTKLKTEGMTVSFLFTIFEVRMNAGPISTAAESYVRRRQICGRPGGPAHHHSLIAHNDGYPVMVF